MRATPVAADEIAMIDFAPFLSGDDAARRQVGQAITHACGDTGFFYLTGHGVDQRLIDDIFGAARAFYAQPEGQRAKALATPDWYRGYVPMPRAQPLTRNTRMFEQYRLQGEWPADVDDMEHAVLFDRPNRWPDAMPAFRVAGEAYLDAMLQLSRLLLRAFALGLGMAEDRFDGWFVNPPSTLSLNYYPTLPPAAPDEVSNMVAHTDEGPFTILAQDRIGGLEVKRRDGVWIAAPPVPGAFTINVGDMMMWWSNGRLVSTPHRVRNRGDTERFSVPYFVNPDRCVVVAPLPELADGTPAYPPIRVADHLARFYAKLSMDPHRLYGAGRYEGDEAS